MHRLLPLLLLLVGCGASGGGTLGAGNGQSSDSRLREAQGTVLENAQHGPELCASVAESLPPQCSGVPLTGWDWAAVEGEETADGVTWGEYRLRGRWDGSALAVVEVLAPQRQEPPRDPVTTPCAEPEPAVDPARADEAALAATAEAARGSASHAGLWIDDTPDGRVLTVATTGDLDEERDRARRTWGGALCLVQHEHALADLLRVQDELSGGLSDGSVLWSTVDEQRGVVELGVVDATAERQAELDARYGDGVVELVPQLRPVG